MEESEALARQMMAEEAMATYHMSIENLRDNAEHFSEEDRLALQAAKHINGTSFALHVEIIYLFSLAHSAMVKSDSDLLLCVVYCVLNDSTTANTTSEVRLLHYRSIHTVNIEPPTPPDGSAEMKGAWLVA